MGRPKRSVRELRIVLDTNALYTQSASDLLSTEIRETIQANSAHPDIKIFWYLPETVVLERHYRMSERAAALLPHLQKIEALLGHNFGITEDKLRSEVDSVIASQLAKFGLEKLVID